MRTVSLACGIALAALIRCEPVAAAQRTFVASSGDDANACSLTAPCRTFAAAMTHTTDGGEVVVLDSAGYGTVTIAQSVSIIAPPGVYAGITASAGESALTIDGADVAVALRGLNVNGLAGSVHGIRFVRGRSLNIDDCIISGFGNSGIRVTGAGLLVVRGTAIVDGGVGVSNVSPSAPERSDLVLDAVSIENNTAGISVAANGRVLVRDASLAGNQSSAIVTGALVPGDSARLLIERSRVVHNGVGIFPGGIVNALGTTTVAATKSTISFNSVGWHVWDTPATTFYTLADNTVRLNTTNQAGKAELVLTYD
jgi:hypothetical protein